MPDGTAERDEVVPHPTILEPLEDRGPWHPVEVESDATGAERPLEFGAGEHRHDVRVEAGDLDPHRPDVGGELQRLRNRRLSLEQPTVERDGAEHQRDADPEPKVAHPREPLEGDVAVHVHLADGGEDLLRRRLEAGVQVKPQDSRCERGVQLSFELDKGFFAGGEK